MILDLKSPSDRARFLELCKTADVLIDPYRPGVLEALNLSPSTVLLPANPSLIVARLTGFRKSGKYAFMAGHDINYLSVSGVLSLLGPAAPSPPAFPSNILADFAGGGAMCFIGILLALMARQRDGKGQIVDANMVDGVGALASMPRLGRGLPRLGDRPRGENLLDGGAPFYRVYATKKVEGREEEFVAVGALEPQFYTLLLKGLGLSDDEIIPQELLKKGVTRMDRKSWPHVAMAFEERFRAKTRKEWEEIFDGTDACVTPVLELEELEEEGYEQKLAVGLDRTPGHSFGGDEGGWSAGGLVPGTGGNETVAAWEEASRLEKQSKKSKL